TKCVPILVSDVCIFGPTPGSLGEPLARRLITWIVSLKRQETVQKVMERRQFIVREVTKEVGVVLSFGQPFRVLVAKVLELRFEDEYAAVSIAGVTAGLIYAAANFSV